MSAHTLGSLIKGLRCANGLIQAELGSRCGYSASAISRIERDAMRVDAARLPLLAAALDIPAERLTAVLPPAPARPLPGTVTPGDEQEDDMRRRHLLTGAVAASLGVAGVVPAHAGTAPPSLDDVLFRLPSVAPVPQEDLARATGRARLAFRAARYDDLARVLPGLLASATAARDAATTNRARGRANILLARAYVLWSELASKQHSDTAWVTADRALTAARSAAHPVPIGEAARVLAIAMRRSGRTDAAVHFLSLEAAALDSTHATTGSVRTTMLLTGAYTAAQGGDRATAQGLLNQAEEQTRRLRTTATASPGLFVPDVSSEMVDVYRIGIATALGTPDDGVPVVRALDVARLPTPERRARAHTDIARMWHAQGDDARTLSALRHVGREAPQELRRPALRSLTETLLYTSAPTPGIRDFALRHGLTT
ncbi:helix-turn-helix domain-containing protein [Streptomyces sp. NPDC088768]|uniref:helix-turn-helix domain-containing protein n=1 Tax=Streptomyces sp. NPDC088768 TaxID=3365894 RepID=UPI00382D4191